MPAATTYGAGEDLRYISSTKKVMCTILIAVETPAPMNADASTQMFPKSFWFGLSAIEPAIAHTV